jgi:hypothetical protein
MEHKETAKNIERTSQYLSDTLLAVIDKLAGKKSNLKLSFEDLTLDTGVMKTKLNGSIVLDIVYSKEAE